MEENNRPRFNQETGERIIYADEINQESEQSLEPIEPLDSIAPVQQAAPAPVQQHATPVQQAVPIPPTATVQQTTPRQAATKQKSGCGGCLKGCLITLIIFLVIVGLVAGGIYAVYKINQPKDVKFDENDVESFYDKVGIEDKDFLPSVEELLAGEVSFGGEKLINDSFTSAEVTAAIQDSSDRNDYFQNVNVRFIGEDQVEVFARISEDFDDIYDIYPDLETFNFIIKWFKGKQIYYVGEVKHDAESGFNLEVEKLKIGFIKLPASMINEYDDAIESLLNDTMTDIAGFGIDSMKINEDSLDVVGSIPEILK